VVFDPVEYAERVRLLLLNSGVCLGWTYVGTPSGVAVFGLLPLEQTRAKLQAPQTTHSPTTLSAP